jgi:hypothetical protein
LIFFAYCISLHALLDDFDYKKNYVFVRTSDHTLLLLLGFLSLGFLRYRNLCFHGRDTGVSALMTRLPTVITNSEAARPPRHREEPFLLYPTPPKNPFKANCPHPQDTQINDLSRATISIMESGPEPTPQSLSDFASIEQFDLDEHSQAKFNYTISYTSIKTSIWHGTAGSAFVNDNAVWNNLIKSLL